MTIELASALHPSGGGCHDGDFFSFVLLAAEHSVFFRTIGLYLYVRVIGVIKNINIHLEITIYTLKPINILLLFFPYQLLLISSGGSRMKTKGAKQ